MIEKLLAMRLHGMADALKTQQQDQAMHELSFLDRLAMLVDQQWNWRENQALQRRLKAAKLRGNTCVEEAKQRIFGGDTHVAEKLVSIFEPTTENDSQGQGQQVGRVWQDGQDPGRRESDHHRLCRLREAAQ
jgi:hypothetical protein